VLLALAALAGAAGCGKKGPPLPPLRNIPAPTKDFTAEQQGPRLRLSLSYPQVTPAGTALGGIVGVEIWSTSLPAPGGTPNPMDTRGFAGVGKLLQKVTGPDLTAATAGSRIEIALPLPAATVPPAPATAKAPAKPPAKPAPAPPAGSAPAGAATPPAATPAPEAPVPQATYYAVRTYGKSGERSDFSNVAVVVPKEPPAAPEHVTVTARADGIQVEWTPSKGATGGYNIYRRAAQERSNDKPLHTSGENEKSWLDGSAKFGQSYIYTVTALARQDPPVESGIASESEIHYIDRFAPPPPTELVALAEPGRVRLVWRPSEADDLAGYIVYRREGDSGAFERITAQPVVSAEYVDSQAAGGKTYVYRVTAVDQSGNESAPGGEVRAAVP
jgi:predicted small lipoprotein YifL